MCLRWLITDRGAQAIPLAVFCCLIASLWGDSGEAALLDQRHYLDGVVELAEQADRARLAFHDDRGREAVIDRAGHLQLGRHEIDLSEGLVAWGQVSH